MARGMTAACVAGAALAVSACGGGGGGSYVPAPGLSAQQGVFEETMLHDNGGMHDFAYGFGQGTGGPPIITSIVRSKLEIDKSPLGVPGGVLASYTPQHAINASLPAPANRDENDPNFGTAFIENGAIQFIPASAAPRISYVGDNILVEYSTAGGIVANAQLITAIEGTQLFGRISDGPTEFKLVYGVLSPYVTHDVAFGLGSKYFRVYSTRVGDQMTLLDIDENPETNPQSATAVAEGTIEQFAAARPDYIGLSHGTIKTVKGARCWVNNTAGVSDGPNPVLLTYRLKPTYGAFCEIGTHVYQAAFTPGGAEIGTLYPPPVGGQPIPRVPYTIRFNVWAADSMEAMLK